MCRHAGQRDVSRWASTVWVRAVEEPEPGETAGPREERDGTTVHHYWQVVGDLTVRDVTRSLVLDVEYSRFTLNPWGDAWPTQ